MWQVADDPPQSLLYVPADRPGAVARAASCAADAIILDLEDAVAPEAKAAAREALAASIASIRSSSARPVIVRLEGGEGPAAEAELSIVLGAKPDAVLLPKVQAAREIWTAKRLIALARPERHPALWAMVETPRAVLDLAAIAEPLSPAGAFVIGLNDLALATGAQLSSDRAQLSLALQRTVLVARAHGLAAFDGVFNRLDDPEGLAAECRQGRALGFDGKTLIHPDQIAVCHGAFAPTASEIAQAEAVVAAFKDPAHQGRGALRVAGRMVERLHLAEAERLLARARRRAAA